MTKLEELYSYIFWYNFHEGFWYAVRRDTMVDFFAGNKSKAYYFRDIDFERLKDVVINQPTVV
jgi:hypothetical protein